MIKISGGKRRAIERLKIETPLLDRVEVAAPGDGATLGQRILGAGIRWNPTPRAIGPNIAKPDSGEIEAGWVIVQQHGFWWELTVEPQPPRDIGLT